MSIQPGATPQAVTQCKQRALKARFKYRVARLRPDESRFQRWQCVVGRVPGALPLAANDSAPLALNTDKPEFGNEDLRRLGMTGRTDAKQIPRPLSLSDTGLSHRRHRHDKPCHSEPRRRRGTSQLQVAPPSCRKACIAFERSFGALPQPQDDNLESALPIYSSSPKETLNTSQARRLCSALENLTL